MKLLLIILTYQRPNVLSRCLDTILNNTSIKPEETWILDDGSHPDIRRGIVNLTIDFSKPESKISAIINGNNLGIGVQFEQAFSLIRQKNPTDCWNH
jgi:GT2 family glycosyltransferase